MFDYDDFYKKHPVSIHDDPVRFSAISSLCKGNVLDVGCGTGTLADFYHGDYVGIDVSEVAIEKAKEIRRKDAFFSVRDCFNLNHFTLEYFNTIVFAEVLEHIENDDEIFDTILKKGKQDVRLIITVPNGDRVPDKAHLRTFTIPELRKKFSPFGKVKFYNWPGAIQRILCTVDFGQKNDELLSLVMIAKDEEKGIENSILSCIEFVGNVVISVDSKSADKTEQIANLYADTLKTHVWENDFSKARNDAAAGVKTKWILALDGHEYVANFDKLDEKLALDADALLTSTKLDSGCVIIQPRIYKSNLKYSGKVHNLLGAKTHAAFSEFLVIHDRKDSQSAQSTTARKKQCDEMVPKLLGDILKKDKKNERALFHLGLFYHSHLDFRKAINYYKSYLKYSTLKGTRWQVCFNLSLCYLGLHNHFQGFYYACQAENEIPNRWEIAKLKGKIFFLKKRFDRASEYFVDSFKINTGKFTHNPWPRNDSETWNLIGECFFNLRNFDKAYTAFDRAAAQCEDKNTKEFFEKRAALMRDIFKDSFRK